MIESVILARDKYLKPVSYIVKNSYSAFLLQNGIVWPSEAEVYLVPCSAEEAYQQRMGIWKNAYGFDFSLYM